MIRVCRWFTHDPALYPDPMTFRPERYITTLTHDAEPEYLSGPSAADAAYAPVATSPTMRSLPLSRNLWRSLTSRSRSRTGRRVDPRIEFELVVVSQPLLYRVSIKPRNEGCRE
jgi:hypothetical protein